MTILCRENSDIDNTGRSDMFKNKTKKLFVCTLCILLSVLCLSSCGARMKLTFESGSIVSGNTKYTPAPISYKPRTYIPDEKFATLDHPIYGKIHLYEVEGTNGGWIYCPTDDTLYRISSVAVPTLEMMDPTSILISTNGNKELSIATLEDKETVKALADLIAKKEDAAVEDNGLIPVRTNKLSFISEEYPHIVYSVSYYEYSNGTYRIYDRDLMLYFEVGSEIHDLLNTANTETTTDAATTE